MSTQKKNKIQKSSSHQLYSFIRLLNFFYDRFFCSVKLVFFRMPNFAGPFKKKTFNLNPKKSKKTNFIFARKANRKKAMECETRGDNEK